jgi:hypothetical protein
MFAAAESKRPDEAMTAYEAFLAGHRLYTEFKYGPTPHGYPVTIDANGIHPRI